MSAAVQVSGLWATATAISHWNVLRGQGASKPAERAGDFQPSEELAVHRRRTEAMLRRYLYASMLVGRTPSLLNSGDTRGMASHQRTKTFEDAVIFVLDMENCLKGLTWFERELLSRIVLQEYSLAEAAAILRVSLRRATQGLDTAVDHLTSVLLATGLLDATC